MKCSRIVVRIMFLVVLAGCGPSTQTPTSILSATDTSTLTHTPEPTATPRPTNTPTPTSSPEPIDTPPPNHTPVPTNTPEPTKQQTYVPGVEAYYRITHFENCADMGPAKPDDTLENRLTFDCVPGVDRQGIIAKLEYEMVRDWTAFWIKLKNADFSPYDVLTFYAKGDFPQDAQQPKLKLELKRNNNAEIGITYFAGLTSEWRQYEVPLAQFERFADMPILCGWNMMSELVFTFEYDNAGAQGVVYLDDIYVERRGQGAPASSPECAPPVLDAKGTIANFDSCTPVNNLGGAMGAAYSGSDSLEESFVDAPDRGCVARLEYDISDWSGFWMKLRGVDYGSLEKLVFDIKGDPTVGIPGKMKIELKRAGNSEVSIFNVSGITAEWQTMRIDLDKFTHAGYGKPLSAFDEMEELVFVFEVTHAGSRGVVYLDNIRLEP